jgi:Holliday junction resolvase RusA-like endonuclease
VNAGDAAIATSIAIQFGADIETIRYALCRDSNGPAGHGARHHCGGRNMSLNIDPNTSIDSGSAASATAVTIVIGGLPTAKGRPRVTRRGITYTPAKTRKYEAHGRLAAQQAMSGRPPISVPVRIEISVDLPVPQSWSAKRQDAALRGDIRPTTRPDTDNYVKSALDAINAMVVADDSLVVELAAIKQYALAPQLTITIVPLPALTAQGRAVAPEAAP